MQVLQRVGGLVEENDDGPWEWEPLLEAALRSDVDGSDVAAAWNVLENWWRDTRRWNDAHKPSLTALLERLRSIVPTVPVENGMERATRHLEPSDPAYLWAGKEYLKPAAEILHSGELKALVDGEPETTSMSWASYRQAIENQLNEYLAYTESTLGDKAMSRLRHASSALEFLSQIDFSQAVAKNELSNEEDQDWLAELVGEIAFAAFDAGRHTQAAWGKGFEGHAATRLKSIKALNDAPTNRIAANALRREKSLEKHEHAKLVRKRFCSGKQTAAADASIIHHNWSKVEGPLASEPAPKIKTLKNWLSRKLI